MKPRVHAPGCSATRDSHAKSVKIYRVTRSRPAILCGLRPNRIVAPTLLTNSTSSGRTQPFALGPMKRTQAATKLCRVLADRAGLPCTEQKALPVADWSCVWFCLAIRTSTNLSPNPPVEILFHRGNGKCCHAFAAPVQLKTKGLGCLTSLRSSTRNFLGPAIKKHLVRRRVKVL
jgi:hypothetical protein